MQTYAFDKDLPSLPVPPLEETCTRLLHWVQPLVDETAFVVTQKAVNTFLKNDGPLLQKELEALAAQKKENKSWLKPFWDAMYLEYRGSLPFHMNYFFQWRQKNATQKQDIFTDTAQIVLGILEYFQKLRQETLPPEKVRGQSMCMDHFRTMFYTRRPEKEKDTLHMVPGNGYGPVHIIVLHKNRFFALSIADEKGTSVSLETLARALEDIKKLPQGEGHTPVSATAATSRENAAGLRNILLQSPQNKKHMQCLEDALFVLCLDSGYTGQEAFCKALLKNAENRWYEKSLQVVVAEDGCTGFNFEHAGCDAGTWMHMLRFIDNRPVPQKEQSAIASVEEIIWDISQELATELEMAHKKFCDFSHKIDLYPVKITHLNKETIKKCKCSPDAFVQLAIQVSQYNTFSGLQSCYEAVSMRHFFQGRTECARPATNAAKALALALQDGLSTKTVRNLFIKAVEAHLTCMKDCKKGHGVERHMLGLYKMWQLKGKKLGINSEPILFKDSGYTTLTTSTVCTSSSGSSFLQYFGFGPVVNHGIGIGYGITSQDLNFILTTQNNNINLQAFAKELEKNLNSFHNILIE